MSGSGVAAVRRYIQNQKEHHKTMTFESEFRDMLESAGLDYNERFLWK